MPTTPASRASRASRALILPLADDSLLVVNGQDPAAALPGQWYFAEQRRRIVD